MSHTTKPTAEDYGPDCTTEQIQEVLASLERWSARTKEHVTYSRKSERHDFQKDLLVEISLAGEKTKKATRQWFKVKSRNLSRSGVGIVLPPMFIPRLFGDDTPFVRGDEAFRVGVELIVKLVPPDGPIILIRSVVKRVRTIHLGFLEAGLRFLERMT